MNFPVHWASAWRTHTRIAMSIGLLIASFSSRALARTETQSFDDEASATAAGWSGARNRDLAGPGTDFGFSASNLAGGAAAGKAGGTFPRLKFPWAYYADTTIGSVTVANPLTASGKLYFENLTFDGGIDIGWINITGDANAASFVLSDRLFPESATWTEFLRSYPRTR